MKPLKLPKPEEVQEIELDGNLIAKVAGAPVEHVDEYTESALELCIGQRCKYCLHEYTSIKDLRARKVVFAGVHEHGKLACRKCWKANQAPA